MSTLPQRQTSHLRKGRINIPGATYFITFNAVRPTCCLMEPTLAQVARQCIFAAQESGDFLLLAGTIMPDHVHLLIRLGTRLSVSQCIGKLKAKSKSAITGHGRWQENFFEHRLRSDETLSAYARYIFLNPYREGLLTRREVWPHWFKCAEQLFDYESMLEDGKFPPTEWLHPEWSDPVLPREMVGE